MNCRSANIGRSVMGQRAGMNARPEPKDGSRPIVTSWPLSLFDKKVALMRVVAPAQIF